jgi:phosphoglucosamine mutase
VVRERIEQARHALGKSGRVLVRASGTEPVVRVMVEHEDSQRAQRTAEDLAAVVRENGSWDGGL